MKYYLLACLAITIQSGVCFSQGRTLRVKAGEDVAQAYSPNGFYRFPQFGKARLYYRTGNKNEGAQFNYNILSGNLQFIGPRGDTLDLASLENIDSVVVNGTDFIYNNGIMEVVSMADSVRLLKKTVIKTEAENIGAYGMPNTTASITNMRSYTTGTNVYSLTVNQDVVVTEVVQWFFADKNNNPVKANKANLLKMLPSGHQSKAEAWLKENKTSFDKEPDLKKLMAAIAGII